MPQTIVDQVDIKWQWEGINRHGAVLILPLLLLLLYELRGRDVYEQATAACLHHPLPLAWDFLCTRHEALRIWALSNVIGFLSLRTARLVSCRPRTLRGLASFSDGSYRDSEIVRRQTDML